MGTIRDFRKETIDYMYENVDTNVDSGWDIFDDFVTGIFKGDSAIREDLSNANRYLREVMELEDITLEKLEQILDDVKAVEDDFINKADKGMGNMRKLGRELDNFINELPTVRPLGQNEEWRGDGIVRIEENPHMPYSNSDATGIGTRSQVRVPPMYNYPGDRSPEALSAVLDALDPLNNVRYIENGAGTWCNIYAWDATIALGCEIPHWYDPQTGLKTEVTQGNEMNCIRMIPWLEDFGPAHGWREVTAQEAMEHANLGMASLAVNPDHVVMLRPNDPNDPDTVNVPVCVHVGMAPNKQYCTVDYAFGTTETPRFFIHD